MPRLGVKINYLYYWSDAFLNPEIEKTQVPVRFDPFDAGVAYAFVKGHWVHCISEHYATFSGCTEREIRLATTELRKQNQRHGQQFTITARKLADFLNSLEAEELLLEQRLRDTEAREILSPKEKQTTADVLCFIQEESHQDREIDILSGHESQAEQEVLHTYEDF